MPYPYSPTTYVDDSPPAIDAANLNKSESALAGVYTGDALDGLQQYAQALGFKAVTHDPKQLLTQHNGTSGVLHGSAVFLPKGITLSNIGVFIVAAGSSLTDVWTAIYDDSYNLVASSADTPSMATGGTGYRSLAMTSAYTTTYSGIYYFADLYVGTTPPAYADINTTISSALSQSPGGQFLWWQQTALASLPATATPVASQVPHFFYAT